MPPRPLSVPLDELVSRLFPDGTPPRLDAAAMDPVLAQAYANAHALIRYEYALALDPDAYDPRMEIYGNAQLIARTVEILARSAAILHRFANEPKPVPAPYLPPQMGQASPNRG